MFESLVDGFLFGFSYALIGIGFTLIFGVMQKFNLAHGPTAIAGAYLGLAVHRLSGEAMPSYVLFAVAVAGSGMIGWLVYQLCFRFLPKEYELAPLMSSMGMLILIEEIISHLTDAQPFEFPNPLLYGAIEFTDNEVILRHDYLLLAAMALAVVGLLYYLIFRTPLGLATRAISQQPVAAELCGARIDRVNALVFILAAAIAGATGFMIAMSIGTIIPGLASVMTVKGLVVAVLGGMGSIPGAIIRRDHRRAGAGHAGGGNQLSVQRHDPRHRRVSRAVHGLGGAPGRVAGQAEPPPVAMGTPSRPSAVTGTDLEPPWSI
jgi:branched-subunit amino acid ABC-type transport system permease component